MSDNNVVKCFAFIECLPEDEKTRAKYFLRKEHIDFDSLCKRFRDDNQGLLPRYAFKRQWESCKPKSRKWKDLLAWWTEWNQMAKRVGKISDEDMIGQFDVVMTKFHPSIIKRIHECEIAGEPFELKQRWKYLA